MGGNSVLHLGLTRSLLLWHGGDPGGDVLPGRVAQLPRRAVQGLAVVLWARDGQSGTFRRTRVGLQSGSPPFIPVSCDQGSESVKAQTLCAPQRARRRIAAC